MLRCAECDLAVTAQSTTRRKAARVAILKHLDGPGQVRPLPAPAGQRAAEITWRVKPNSLLAVDQDGCGDPQLLAGKQVTDVPVRGYGLNPVFGYCRVFASLLKYSAVECVK